MDEQGALFTQLQKLSLEVSSGAGRDLLRFLDELLRWNRHRNLTAIVDPVEAVEKHLIDSLTVLPLLAGNERLLDIGSGGGFPALPLKIVRPSLAVVSIDAVAKKIAFQRHIARALDLQGFEALHLRAEALSERAGYKDGFDVIVSRAFAAIPVFTALALPCLAPGGKIIAMKGADGEKELAEATTHLSEQGLTCVERKLLQLPTSGARRCLLVFRRS